MGKKKSRVAGVKRLAGEISGLIKRLVAKKIQSRDSGLIPPVDTLGTAQLIEL